MLLYVNVVAILCLTTTNVRHGFQFFQPDISPGGEAGERCAVEFGLKGNALRGVSEVHFR